MTARFWDWHGMHPLVSFSADEWPWEPGYSLSEDIDSIGRSRDSFMRGLDQTAKQRFDPALLYDKNAGLNRKTMEQFDPYEERGRLGVDGAIDDKVIRTALPEELMSIPEWAFAYDTLLEKKEDYILGNDAMDNLARAKVAGADDALLKAMEEAGPIVKDISNGLNEPVSDLMMMCLSLVGQYYPTGRIMQYVGADGVSREVFDLDSAALVPSHMEHEDKSEKSAFTRMQRWQNFCAALHADIAPGGIPWHRPDRQQADANPNAARWIPHRLRDCGRRLGHRQLGSIDAPQSGGSWKGRTENQARIRSADEGTRNCAGSARTCCTAYAYRRGGF